MLPSPLGRILPRMQDTLVRFVESGSGVLSLLEVESDRGRGLFGRIVASLFSMRIQLVRAESKLRAGRRLERLWVVELDGGPIREKRRLEIQDAVLRALEADPAPRPRNAYLTSSRGRAATKGDLPPAA